MAKGMLGGGGKRFGSALTGGEPDGEAKKDNNYIPKGNLPAYQHQTKLVVGQVHDIPLDLIVPSPYQPRLKFDDESVVSLAASIEESDLIRPVTVRRLDNGKYELIGGETRFRAHQYLERPTIQSIVQDMDDHQAKKAVLVDNVLQKRLTDYELGKAVKDRIDDGTYTSLIDAAKSIGVDRKQIYRYLSFLDLPSTIIRALDEIPDLIGSNTAEALKIYIGEHQGKVTDQILGELLVELRAGTLKQNMVVHWLTKKLTEAGTPPTTTTEIQWKCEDKVVGKAEFKKKKIVLSFDDKLIDPEKLQERFKVFLAEEGLNLTREE